MPMPTSSSASPNCSARGRSTSRRTSRGWGPAVRGEFIIDPVAVMSSRVVVGMSGGVDSSVAAALLVERGVAVVGVTMRVWPWKESDEPTRRFGSCCGSEAVDDARRVARELGIPYYVLNMEAEFDRAVIGPFADEYRHGRTPVPCVACNVDLKFGSLLARARAWDAAGVATGHYARVTRDEASGRWLLWRGRDARKDQSDFLWPLRQSQLAAAHFPVGDLDAAANRLTVGPAADLERDRLTATRVNFIACDPPREPLRVQARIRHSHRAAPATVVATGAGEAEVVFDAPQRAITPGQSVVWYRDDLVVGGGVILR